MSTRKTKFGYLVRLEKGESVKAKLEEFARKEGIDSAWLEAIGALRDPKLSYYNLKNKKYLTKKFAGEFEVGSLTGNIAILKNQPVSHLHTVLSDQKFQTIVGHLNDATVTGTLEAAIFTDPTLIERKFDSQTGLNLWEL